MAESNGKRRLYRVILRGHDYLGTGEEWHAKVVAPDFMSALDRAMENMQLDAADLDGSAVTLIASETELADGKVFDVARRSRAFGERGGWVLVEEPRERESDGPRQTPLL